jgi:hypothetical protein
MKTKETGPNEFHRFLINRPMNLIFLKILIFLKKWFIGFGTGLPVIPTGFAGFQPLSAYRFTSHTDW